MSRTANRAGLSGPAGLSAAVFYLAIGDVRNGNGHAVEARDFILSPWAARWWGLLCDVLDLGYDAGDLRRIVGQNVTQS